MSTFFEEKKTVKSENFTIRIDPKVLESIRSYAKTEKSTINAVINQLLLQSVEWDITAARAGWFPIPKEIIVNIFEQVSEKYLLELASKFGKKVTREMLLTMRGKGDVEDWVSIIRSRAKAANFHYSEIDEVEYLKLVMRHDMGARFSKYLIAFYDESFKELGCKAEFDFTDNTFIVNIDKKFFNASEQKKSI